MYYSIAAVAVNIGLNFVFIQFWGFAGLAAATSCAGLVNFGLLWINLRRKIIGLDYKGSLLKAAGIILAAAAAMLLVYLCDYPRILDGTGLRDKILIVGLQIVTAGLSYMVIARLLRIEEVGRLLRALRLRK
jgi:putative peptidoglycan lipid II flippase